MVKIYQKPYTRPTKEELQKLSEDFSKYARKFLKELGEFERRSRESKLVVKACN